MLLASRPTRKKILRGERAPGRPPTLAAARTFQVKNPPWRCASRDTLASSVDYDTQSGERVFKPISALCHRRTYVVSGWAERFPSFQIGPEFPVPFAPMMLLFLSVGQRKGIAIHKAPMRRLPPRCGMTVMPNAPVRCRAAEPREYYERLGSDVADYGKMLIWGLAVSDLLWSYEWIQAGFHRSRYYRRKRQRRLHDSWMKSKWETTGC